MIFAAMLLLNFSIIKALPDSDILAGSPQSCENEGERVSLNIKDTRCFTCWCRKHQVVCEQEKCPGHQGCYRLLNESKDGCCQLCKGCIYQGVHHQSDSEWRDIKKPCINLTCKAGVVTESEIKCYTPCRNPQPPPHGLCCPTCPGCKINGQLVRENHEVAIAEDPCLKCQCKNGRISCSKKACPVLHCPSNHIYRVSGECCTQCHGSRHLIEPPKGACMLGMQVHAAGKTFRPDHCTLCSCINATFVCHRKTCPVLECPTQYQITTPGSCCSQCSLVLESKDVCTFNGHTYEEGESWELGPCKTCVCRQGQARCAMQMCPQTKLPCPANYKTAHKPGDCCPRCVENEGVCTVFGDPHYRTFDGKFYSFHGPCKYQLSADCIGRTFSIRVTNDARSMKTSSWTKTVSIKVGNLKVNLGQKKRIKVNGQKVNIPYKMENKIFINKTDDSLFIEMHIGLKVQWDGKSFLEISVPALYKKQLCGLCGNFNSEAQDDFTTRRGRLVLDAEKFGASWRVGGKKTCRSPEKQLKKESQCEHQTYYRNMENIKKCGALQTVFSSCHKQLSFFHYLQSCIVDMCECSTHQCHCDSFTAYAHECQKLGVPLSNWRSLTNCPSLWAEHMSHKRPPPHDLI